MKEDVGWVLFFCCFFWKLTTCEKKRALAVVVLCRFSFSFLSYKPVVIAYVVTAAALKLYSFKSVHSCSPTDRQPHLHNIKFAL